MSALSDAAQAQLRRFGWQLGPEFERRYMTDAWVFNLVNAIEKVAAERDELRAVLESGEVGMSIDPMSSARGQRSVWSIDYDRVAPLLPPPPPVR